MKGAQAGRAARIGLAVSAGTDAGIAVYRANQGVDAALAGDDWTAAAKFGDAALRLVGVGVNTAAYLKAAGRGKIITTEADAAVAEVTAAANHVGGAAPTKKTLDGLKDARNLIEAPLQVADSTCGLRSAVSVIDDVAPGHGSLNFAGVRDEIRLNGGLGLNEVQLVKFLDNNLPSTSAAVLRISQTEDDVLALLNRGQLIAATDGNHWVRVLGVVQEGNSTWVRIYDPARGNYEQLLSSFMTRVYRNDPAARNYFIQIVSGR